MIKYFATVGNGDTPENPGGVFRERTQPGERYLEYMTLDGEWISDPALVRYFAGYADEAEPITAELAKTIRARWMAVQKRKRKNAHRLSDPGKTD